MIELLVLEVLLIDKLDVNAVVESNLVTVIVVVLEIIWTVPLKVVLIDKPDVNAEVDSELVTTAEVVGNNSIDEILGSKVLMVEELVLAMIDEVEFISDESVLDRISKLIYHTSLALVDPITWPPDNTNLPAFVANDDTLS